MLPTAADEMALSTLIGRATDDVRELVSAEIELGKAKLVARALGARNAIILLVVAVFLLQAALTTLLVGFALGLERWAGPLGGAAIVFVVTLIVIGVLAKIAVAQFSSGKPATEKKP